MITSIATVAVAVSDPKMFELLLAQHPYYSFRLLSPELGACSVCGARTRPRFSIWWHPDRCDVWFFHSAHQGDEPNWMLLASRYCVCSVPHVRWQEPRLPQQREPTTSYDDSNNND